MTNPNKTVPDITPYRSTNVEKWTPDEIASAFNDYGMKPGGTDSFGTDMAEVSINMSKLPDADRRAIALYLKSIPKIPNVR